MKSRQLILGGIFWLAILSTGWIVMRTELEAQSSSVSALAADVNHWVSGQQTTFDAVSEWSFQVAVGDPVFLELPDGSFRHVGLATDLHAAFTRDAGPSRRIDVSIYASAVKQFPNGFQLEYHTTPTSLDWVVKMMIPPERQKAIARLITDEWAIHQKEVMGELRPVLGDGLRTAVRAIEGELPTIFRSHRDDFRKLGQRYEDDIVKAEMIPLVREVILPIVEEEAVPVATEVGKALWKRVSLWSFTWRYFYDKSPLPQRDTVKTEFQRFIDEEALPELRSRTDEFIDVMEAIVKRSMEHPKVKAALKKNFRQIAEDPELHALLKAIVREAVVDNETLRQEFDAFMREQETRAAVKLAGERLEPTVREIGDLIFGTREKGITPEFSRILRAQILTKDRRWFVMVPSVTDDSADGTITIDTTDLPMSYPMGFAGSEQSPLTPAELKAAP